MHIAPQHVQGVHFMGFPVQMGQPSAFKRALEWQSQTQHSLATQPSRLPTGRAPARAQLWLLLLDTLADTAPQRGSASVRLIETRRMWGERYGRTEMSPVSQAPDCDVLPSMSIYMFAPVLQKSARKPAIRFAGAQTLRNHISLHLSSSFRLRSRSPV